MLPEPNGLIHDMKICGNELAAMATTLRFATPTICTLTIFWGFFFFCNIKLHHKTVSNCTKWQLAPDILIYSQAAILNHLQVFYKKCSSPMQTNINGFVFVCFGPNQPPANPLPESLPLVRMKTITRHQVGRFVKRPARGGDEMSRGLKRRSLSIPPQLCPERKRRRQEKMVARQARREQLKRLHRAQVLRCCSISHSCTLKRCSGPQRLFQLLLLPRRRMRAALETWRNLKE